MGQVVIGMDPRKRSATIEVIDEREQVQFQGPYDTDTDGYQQMLAAGRRFPDQVWAIEGCAGIGHHVAQRLVADGETVLDVPPKLSARVRVLDTGQGRQTDPVDAHTRQHVAADLLRPVAARTAHHPRGRGAFHPPAAAPGRGGRIRGRRGGRLKAGTVERIFARKPAAE
jgi:hypothetical protein